MKSIKLITRIAGSIVLVLLVLLSCKKEQTQTPPPGANGPTGVSACSENSGSFTIDINGEHYELAVDSATQYIIVYNWYDEQVSSFAIEGKDQNSNYMYIEFSIPGKFNLGSTTYSTNSVGYEFFDIIIDTLSYNVSNVVFDVTTSNLDTSIGIYKPVKASFTGVAHSITWTYGQEPPVDTVNISGAFCLNGAIVP